MEYRVTAPRLNGRERPDTSAPVGTVRELGDSIEGEKEGSWVVGGDGLYYMIDFLEPSGVVADDHEDDDDDHEQWSPHDPSQDQLDDEPS